MKNERYNVIAVVGDGALSGGEALEGGVLDGGFGEQIVSDSINIHP